MVRKVAITGTRGSWFASVDGEDLPVLHQTWWTGKDRYRDPMTGEDIGGKRYSDYVRALQAHDLVVVQKDKGGGDLSRSGYIGIFRFTDLEVESGGAVNLRLVEEVARPKT